MAVSFIACALTNVVPDVNPNIAARNFSLKLQGTVNGEIAAGGPYTITVKDNSDNVIVSWPFSTVSPSLGQSTISPNLTPSQAPAGFYTIEVFGVGLGGTLTQSVTMTDSVTLSTATYLVSLSAPCALGTGSIDFTLKGEIPGTYIIYDQSLNVVETGIISGSGLSVSGLAAGSYTAKFLFSTNCDTPLSSSVPSGYNELVVPFSVVPTNVPIEATYEVVSVDCESANGEITVTPTNGTGPYTYEFEFWNGSSWIPVESLGATAIDLITGTYLVTITDANGCTGYVTVIVPFVPGSCGGCFALTDCFPGAQGSPTYYVNGSILQGMDGFIINGVVITGQYMDPTKCWLVTAVTDNDGECVASLPITAFNDFFSECDPCKYVPAEVVPPVSQSVSDPVRIFYEVKESECDIQAVKSFAGGYSSLIKKLKYGVTDCCKDFNLAQLWVNKQVSDLSQMVIAGYECRATPNNGCGWLPLSGCEICPNTTGGITILAVAGEDILFGKLVMLSNDGKLYLNDPTLSTTYQRCIGFTTMDVLKNNTVRVLIMGLFTNVNWSLTNGSIYYASQSGGISSTIPVNPPLVISQVVGTATSSTTLLVDIKQPNII